MPSPLPQIRCGLCQGPIGPRDSFFRATGDFLPRGDPAAALANTPMHWPCYMAWPERPRFARYYVDAWVQANRRNPFWWSVYRDERVYVSANPLRGVEEVSVRLYALGTDVRVPLPRWSEWVRDIETVTPRLHECELAALREVLPVLQARFPDDHAVVDAIDPSEKAPRRQGTNRR